MEYTVSKLAKLSNVSTRTLRYYDEINLLNPAKLSESGYRLYEKEQVDRLQQILFYKALDVPLEEIGKILDNPNFDPVVALADHHQRLMSRKEQLETLIVTIEKSIETLTGGIKMTDQEKFKGFTEKLILENEEKYGDEIRKKYGEGIVQQSYAKMREMTKLDHDHAKKLGIIINEKLKESFHLTEELGHLNTDIAQEVFYLHKEWIIIYWPTYSSEAHKGLGDMYVADDRFRSYYDAEQEGLATHLRDIIHYYAK